MRVVTVTGNARDFIELTAENTAECVDLMRVATSKFIPEDTVYLDLGSNDRPKLRIWVGEARPVVLDAATRAAIDATP